MSILAAWFDDFAFFDWALKTWVFIPFRTVEGGREEERERDRDRDREREGEGEERE